MANTDTLTGAPAPKPNIDTRSAAHSIGSVLSAARQPDSGAVINANPADQKFSYWEDPQRVARYYNYMRSSPPDAQLPDFINKDELTAAYQYMKFRNQDAPVSQWKMLPTNDPALSFIRGMAQPPPQYQMPGDIDWGAINPPEQPNTDPFGSWDQLKPWQQLYLGIFAPQPGLPGRPDSTRMTAAVGQGLLAGLGTGAAASALTTPLGGALIGGGVGLATAYEAYTGTKIPIVGDLLQLLNILPEGAERTIGLVGQAADQGLGTVLANLPQAWQAAHLTYETQQQSLLDVWAQLAGDQPAGPGQVWQISQGNPNPVALQGPRGVAALNDIRRRMINGEDPVQLYAEYLARFGDTGTFNDFLQQTVLDPTLLAEFGASKAGAGVARLAGQERLAAALSEGAGSPLIASLPMGAREIVSRLTGQRGPEGLLTSVEKYRGWIQTGYFPGNIERKPAAQLSDFEKWAGKLTPEGQIAELQPTAAAQGLVSWGRYLSELTPAAKAEAMMNLAHDNLNVLFSLADSNPEKMVQILRQAAGIDPAAMGEVGQAVLGSPVTATISQALRDVLKTNWDQDLLLRWTEADPKRQALEQAASNLKMTPGEFLDEFDRNPDALARRIAAAGGPLGDVQALRDTFGIFTGHDALPWDARQFQAQLSITIFDKMADYLVQRFGITTEPAVFRLSKTLKGMQSLLLLGFNPAYFVNNMTNNVASRAATGVFGYMTPRQITHFLDRFGLTPERLGEAITPGGEPSGRGAIYDAGRGSDWISKLHQTITATNNKLGVFSRFSAAGEKIESRNAFTIGMLKFWGQSWRRDVGFRRMPAAVEAMLDSSAPGVKELIYRAIESGMNMQEINRALLGETIRPQLKGIIDDVAGTLYPDDPTHGADVLQATGIQAQLERLLSDADTPQKVNAAWQRVTDEVNRIVDEHHAREVASRAEDLTNRVRAEGQGVVLSEINDLQARIAEVNAKGDPRAWARTAEYAVQTYAGLLKGLGADDPLIKVLTRAADDFRKFDKTRRKITQAIEQASGAARKEAQLKLDELYQSYNERASLTAQEIEKRTGKAPQPQPGQAAPGTQPAPAPTAREVELQKLAAQFGLTDAQGRPVLAYLKNVVNRNRPEGQKYTDPNQIPLDEAEQALKQHQAATYGDIQERQRTVQDAYNQIVSLADQRAREAHIRANGMLTARLAREQFMEAFKGSDAEAAAALALVDQHADLVARANGHEPNTATRDAWYATRVADVLGSDDPRTAWNQMYQEAAAGITNYRGEDTDPVNAAMVRGMDMYHAGDLRGLDAVKWGIQQGINHLADIIGPEARKAAVAFGKFVGSEEPTIYLRLDVSDEAAPGLFYALSQVGDVSFNQWAVLFSRRAPADAVYGPTSVGGLAGRIEPAIDIKFNHPLGVDEFAVIDRVTNELGIGGYTVNPAGDAIEIMRVDLYNGDHEPGEYAQTFHELARRLDSAGISGVPELYSREVWLSNKDTSDPGRGTYTYDELRTWFEHNGRAAKEEIDRRLAARPYVPTQPPANIQAILKDVNKPTGVLYQWSNHYQRMVQEVIDKGFVDLSKAREVFAGGTPEYLASIIRFITEQRKKYDQGQMTPRDVAKAYLITVSSQGASERPLSSARAAFEKAGVEFVQNGEPIDFTPYVVHVGGKDTIRPEDITGVWLMTDQGKRALNLLEKTGEIGPEWQVFLNGRHNAFGRFGNEPDPKHPGDWWLTPGARYKLGKKGQHLTGSKYNLADLHEITKRFNEAKGDPQAVAKVLTSLAGVDVGKSGFVKHLLGFGDELTLDTQEAHFWGESVPSDYTQAFGWGNWAQARVEIKQMITDAFAQLRAEGFGADVPEEAFNHIMHHWLWDYQKGQENHHIGMYSGQLLGQGAKGGVYFLRDGRAVIRAMQAPDVSTMVHEIGHIFRRDLAPDQLDVVAKLGGLTDARELANLELHFQRGELLPGDPQYQRLVDAEELFARGWERYLAEGDAPTPELRGIFQQFTDWMLSIYRRLRSTLDNFTGQRQISGFSQQPDFEVGGRTVDIRAQVNGMSLRDIFDRLLTENPNRGQAADELPASPTPEPPTGPAADLVNDRLKNLPIAVAEQVRSVAIQMMNELQDSRQVVNQDTHVRQWEGPEWYRQILEANGGGDGLKARYMSALRSIASGRDKASPEVTAHVKQIILDRASGQAGIESNIQPAVLRYLGDNETLFQVYGDKILSSERPALERMFGPEWNQVVDEYLLWAAEHEQNGTGPLPDMGPQTDIEGQSAQPLPPIVPGTEAPQLYQTNQGADQNGAQVPEGGTPAPEPYGSALDEVTRLHVLPLLEQSRRRYLQALSDRPTRFAELDPQAQQGIKDYLRQVESDMASTKYATMRYGQQMRDGALLNYSRRYGADNLLDLVFPYQFWYTRSMANWAKRMIDKPQWWGMYARLRQAQERNADNMPTRLKGKMRLPAPWLPDWAGGGLWMDPIGKLFPPANFGQPLEQYAQNQTQVARQAEAVLQDWAKSGTITQQEAATAIASRSGPTWEKAMGQAASDVDQDASPMGLLSLMINPSLFWQAGQNLLTGHPDRISPLPITRTASAFQTALQGTALEGVGNLVGLAAQPERLVRKAAGLSEFGQWGDYYVDRQLANMAADGTISPEQARIAMIERQGPIFDQAYQRVQYEQMLQVPGAASLGQAARGQVVNALEALPQALFGGTLFPTGELRLRGLADDFRNAYNQYDRGDSNALNNFFADHPEYEARLALNQPADERLKQFLISGLWDKYSQLPKPNRNLAADQLGDTFRQAFLNKETRSYDSISVDTLARWNQMLGGAVPKTPETAPAIEQPEPPVELYPPDLVGKIETYQAERARRYPNISAMQSAYYAVDAKDKKGRKAVLAQFPQLTQYWDWNRQYKAAHPDMQNYWDQSTGSNQTQSALPARELQSLDPVLMRQVLAWNLAGQPLTAGAQKELARLAQNHKLTGEDYARLLVDSVLPSGGTGAK